MSKITEAFQSTVKALSGRSQAPESAKERRAAVESRRQEIAAKREAAAASLAQARSSAEATCRQRIEEIECERSTLVEAENERISNLFMTRQDKQSLREQAASRFHEEAQKKRDAAEGMRDKAIGEADAKYQPVTRECERCAAELEADAERAERDVSVRLLADFRATIAPLIERYVEVQSKTNAEAIGRCYWDANVRAKRELGEELWPDVLFTAYGDAIAQGNPAAATKLGQDFHVFTPAMHAITAFTRSLEEGATEIGKAMYTLHDVMEELVSSAKGEPEEWLVRRLAVKRTWATRGEAVRGEEAFRKEEERKAREARAARAANPPRVMKSLSQSAGGKQTITYDDGTVLEVLPGQRLG